MNFKRGSIQQVVQHAAILVAGSLSLVAGNSAIAQPPSAPLQSVQMAAQPSSIQGNWRLANMTEPPFPTPMLPTEELTADFSKGRVAGSGGCNRFNGSYTLKGNQLKIGPLASTFKACEAPIMQQESRFLKGLQAAQRYEITQDGLQIFYQTPQGTGVLRFTAQPAAGNDSGSNSGGTSGSGSQDVRGLW